MKRKIVFVTGSRGEWGYIRPILKLIELEADLEYVIVATNMHLSPGFGLSVNEIISDGFKVRHKIPMSIDAYDHHSQTKSLGMFLISFSDIIRMEEPDIILLAGDRGEQLIGALAGAYMYIPTIHIQAGEKSGNIDGAARHAIGKLAHIHIASNQDAYNRLINLGEEKFRTFNYGAPQVDELVQNKVSSREEFNKRHNHMLPEKFILAVYHPVTEEFLDVEENVDEFIQALKLIGLMTVFIMPNNDAGSSLVSKALEQADIEKLIFRNLPREDYLSLLKECSAIIGNSSSGLLEAPYFGTPCINIGNRQRDRFQGRNVINACDERFEIKAAFDKTQQEKFQFNSKESTNPYGDGKSSARIIKLMKSIDLSDINLLNKNLTL